ncbi:hypothetical protein PVAP13_2KG109300 [Panicum virgatum]|uniref:Uncharacterized protein n=1 Tax=Panicum virgatum TaxID=38727 RepID=A0A8T0VWL0_PANVG|nr:hypothetical protein PVAP13_2KG109300 [Panicum virgatum]
MGTSTMAAIWSSSSAVARPSPAMDDARSSSSVAAWPSPLKDCRTLPPEECRCSWRATPHRCPRAPAAGPACRARVHAKGVAPLTTSSRAASSERPPPKQGYATARESKERLRVWMEGRSPARSFGAGGRCVDD